MLELFRSDHFADVSANQWLGLTPPEIVGATLKLSHSTIATLRKDETLIMLSDAVIVTVQHMDDSFEVFGGTIYPATHFIDSATESSWAPMRRRRRRSG
jgi:hypothetical protein